jgi:AcrR family transcriptional regulator
MKRRTRQEQAAATRAALLEAARTVFLKSGYHGATVDAVAQEAGFTIGAVYSRFGGKAELFLALLEERISERAEQIRSLLPTGSRPDVAAIARQWSGILASSLDWTLLVIEFRVHAARQPELAGRFSELHDRLVQATADALGRSLAGRASADAGQVEEFARVALAMGPGAALARAAEGDAFSDRLMEEATVAVAQHLLGPLT